VIEFLPFLFVGLIVPLFVLAGARMETGKRQRIARHKACLANTDRLERELGIAGMKPYEPSIRYLGHGQFMATGGNGTTIALPSAKVEYQKLLADMEPPPHFLQYEDGAEVDLDRDLQPKVGLYQSSDGRP
jgi:hypothetical protein